jgi:hypothetical protein
MNKLKMLLILPLLLVGSCTFLRQNDEKALVEVQNRICKPLEKQHLIEISLSPQGSEGVRNPLWLGFKSYRYHFRSVEAARPFFTKVIREILTRYNEVPFIVSKHPVEAKDLWVRINFYKHAPNAPLPVTQLYRVELENGVVSYYKWDMEADDLIAIHSETYSSLE